MVIDDVGQGPPLVLIPGIQGRWEYLRPAIQALARSFRVLTFPLSGERHSERRLDRASGIDNDARQVLELLDGRGIERATVCGISFGGLPAFEIRGGPSRANRGADPRFDAWAGMAPAGEASRVRTGALAFRPAVPRRVAASPPSRSARRPSRASARARVSPAGNSERSRVRRCRRRAWRCARN